jgi:hypothetical protein
MIATNFTTMIQPMIRRAFFLIEFVEILITSEIAEGFDNSSSLARR